MVKFARENDRQNGYYAGLFNAFMAAQDIPDNEIADLEYEIKNPEDAKSS